MDRMMREERQRKRSFQRRASEKGEYLTFISFQGMTGKSMPCNVVWDSLHDKSMGELGREWDHRGCKTTAQIAFDLSFKELGKGTQPEFCFCEIWFLRVTGATIAH